MVKCDICVVLFLGVYLVFSVSVWAENITDDSSEQDRDGFLTVNISSTNLFPFGLASKSFYDDKCDCGYMSSGCSYVDGKKICNCYRQYSQNGDRCEECDCGYPSSGCSFVDGKKICNCDWQYSQNGGRCERCDCGTYSNKCYFENRNKICSCYRNFKQNGNGQCAECGCGPYSTNCTFEGSRKVCTCKPGYPVNNGKCEKCDCGPMATSCELTFSNYTRCTCKPGYVAERTTWDMHEMCKLPGPSGWRIATYIESVVFGCIFIVCFLVYACNRK